MSKVAMDVLLPDWTMPPSRGYLTDVEREQLDVLFGCILPGDHLRQIPSAREAGASIFVDKLLARDASVYWEIPNWRTLYRVGLSALDDYAKATFQRALVELSGEQLDQIMSQLESASLVGMASSVDQRAFFTALRRHCIQGCFADPRWGGNTGKLMWRAIGYLQPPETIY